MRLSGVLLAVSCLLSAVSAQWLATIHLPDSSAPRALCYNPQNNKIYCANRYSDTVTVIDGATNGVLRTIDVGDVPIALCHNPAQNRVYMANREGPSISVLPDSMVTGIE